MIARKPLALSSLLALAACNMAPHYVRPAMPVPAATPQGPSYAPAQDGSAAIADLSWQAFFTDDRLRKLIAVALDNNRDLRIAVANVAQARAQYRVQNADIFPTIGVNGGGTFQRIPGQIISESDGTASGGGGASANNGLGTLVGASNNNSIRSNIYSASVGVSAWEVDLFGRVRNLSQAAQEQFFAAAENRDAARTSLIAEVATAWLNLAADRDRLRIAQDTARAYGETLIIIQGRAHEGSASDLDVKQAQTSYEQARSDIASTTTAVAQDRNALDLLAGTPVSADLLPAELGGSDVTITDLPAGLPSQLLLRRPDVAGAEDKLRAANADIGAARAAFFPQISLTAAFGTTSLGLSNLFGNGSSFWSVAPSVTLPIFDFGKNRGNLHYAEATRDAMVATYEKSVQTAFREVADALARRGTIDEQLSAQVSLRDAAQGSYRLADARYQEGVDSFLNTLDAQRSYYSAQQTLVATRLARQSNAVELYRALGGGLK
ncbi:efflux transporter outer membrane subunit [Sphingomonas abietis]|uniref:Efflux transporter outer membrane subunit n=1 Tax=Sphingomonas abietis TaxID=3012344 RepID=A0ABY7NRK3_9SPHN|nr:efflux transporter outer membrane subunit [Sphingomonas abietis]WBO23263.1 efflux transporter outer membrane subunit [Sphingomonas abietis]